MFGQSIHPRVKLNIHQSTQKKNPIKSLNKLQFCNPIKHENPSLDSQCIDVSTVDYLKKSVSKLNSAQNIQSLSSRKRGMQSLDVRVLKQHCIPEGKQQTSCSPKPEISPITNQCNPFVLLPKHIEYEQTKRQSFRNDNFTHNENKRRRTASHSCQNSTQSVNATVKFKRNKTSGVPNYDYPIWENKDALCWLDSTLSLLVHCKKLKVFFNGKNCDTCLLKEVFVTYRKVFNMLNSAENKTQRNSVRAYLYSNICKKFEIVRENVFNVLQPELQCKKGDEESPIFALPIILKKSSFSDIFLMNFSWKLKCQVCSHGRTTCNQKPIITFPNTPNSFSLDEPYFLTSCFNCKAPNQRMYLQLAYLPDVMLFHFMQGLPDANIPHYDIKHLGKIHRVIGIIQYCKNIRHFVAWIRNPKDESWLCCDDMKTSPQQFLPNCPEIPPSEIHILMWEQDSAEMPNSIHAEKCGFVKDVISSNDKQSSTNHPVFTIDDCNILPIQNLDTTQMKNRRSKTGQRRGDKEQKK